jgi:hypothetical protein
MKLLKFYNRDGSYSHRGAYPKVRFLLENCLCLHRHSLCCELCSSPIHMHLHKWQ